MHYLCVINLLCLALAVTATAKLTNGGLKHLKLRLDLETLDMSNVEEKWIDQPLNQYDPQDNRTFKMRYFQNLDYWKPNGPMYVFLGGEWEDDGEFIASAGILLIAQLAKETNGAMFDTEHRYYGQSLPDIPKDDKVKYFKYLSSKQALADIAILIMKLKSDPKFKSSPVVVVGGSYSGNLATWMRVLYPDVVDAAIANSAPILAKKDFNEYLDIVYNTFSKYGTENCIKNIGKTFKRIEDLLNSSAGIEILKKELNICPSSDLTVLENKQCLFEAMYDAVKGAAQQGPVSAVKDICHIFESDKLDILIGSEDYCKNFDKCWTQWQEDHTMAAWTYQYCNEFGYLQTTSSEKQPFVHWSPLEFWLKSCKGFVEGDIEKKIDEGVAKTNKMYGGRFPKVSKVVFTHGDMDPWHALGMLPDLAPDARSLMINGTAHCHMLMEWAGESQEVKEKRKYIKELIKKWISNE